MLVALAFSPPLAGIGVVTPASLSPAVSVKSKELTFFGHVLIALLTWGSISTYLKSFVTVAITVSSPVLPASTVTSTGLVTGEGLPVAGEVSFT